MTSRTGKNKAGSSLAPTGDDVDRIVAEWRSERPDLDPSPIALFGRIHRNYMRYQTATGKVFEKYGVNSASFGVLASLRRSGPPYRMTGTQLAADSLLSSAGVTFRLDRLEQADLIVRQRDNQDRRVVYSALTDKGLKIIESAIEHHLETEQAMLVGLTRKERDELARLLAKLEASIVTSQLDSSS